MSVLQEIPLLDGSVMVDGTVAYVSQRPWVFASSLRQNILFGKEYDEKKYQGILEACALDKVSNYRNLFWQIDHAMHFFTRPPLQPQNEARGVIAHPVSVLSS